MACRRRDFDADGYSDMVWRYPSGAVEVWYRGEGSRRVAPNFFAYGANVPLSWELKGVGDFNGDGHDDMVWQHPSGGTPWVSGLRGLTHILNDYPGDWEPVEGWKIQGVGDFDGDRRADILMRSPAGQLAIWWKGRYENIAYPTHQNLPNAWPSPDWKVQAIVDLNADRKSDIVLRRDNGELTMWMMDGGRWLWDPGVMNIPTTWRIVGSMRAR